MAVAAGATGLRSDCDGANLATNQSRKQVDVELLV
jgi:hypothetical protein